MNNKGTLESREVWIKITVSSLVNTLKLGRTNCWQREGTRDTFINCLATVCLIANWCGHFENDLALLNTVDTYIFLGPAIPLLGIHSRDNLVHVLLRTGNQNFPSRPVCKRKTLENTQMSIISWIDCSYMHQIERISKA